MSPTSWSKVSSLLTETRSTECSRPRGSMPRARSWSMRPALPGKRRRSSSPSSAASCPIVSRPARRSLSSDLGPTPGSLPHVERREERSLAPGRHDGQPGRLAPVARHLGYDLARRDAERGRQARRAADGGLHRLRDPARREKVGRHLADVEIALVQAGALDRRDDVADGIPHGARVLAVDRVSRGDEHRVRAPAHCFGAAHRRVDPELACEVVRRRDDASPTRVASYDERHAPQRRILELLDRGVERVEIEVRDDHRKTPIRTPPQTMSPAATITCRPISSLLPMMTAASSTPNSASVAMRGLTTLTRPR